MSQEAIVRFDNISFYFGINKPILDEVSFSIRRGSKITLMGQNGAGKSTLFSLILGEKEPEEGTINIVKGVSVAIARQIIAREDMSLSVREFFQKVFKEKIYDIDKRIDEVLEIVNLQNRKDIYEKKINNFSGGQQARLLLAQALIQKSDLLLLDEPTNNLDKDGIEHLTNFLVNYNKTVLVISHDAEFLNSFSDGVLYLDVFTRKIEQYVGNYFDVVKQITARVEKENMKNAQLAKQIQAKKDQANKFAYKGGNLRLVARRMREKAEELEEDMVDVRKEDRTIRDFKIPAQEDMVGEIINISYFTILKNGKEVKKKVEFSLNKNMHLLIKGPNGIGKSTLLGRVHENNTEGSKIKDGIRIGYYRQDFSNLDFDETVYACLARAMQDGGEKLDEERMRSVASGFLITGEIIKTKIGFLSEGQKGLVAFAKLVLEKPGVLILDEPTNHINFRHIPIIAKALSDYKGVMLLVSHVNEFVQQIRIDETLDLEK